MTRVFTHRALSHRLEPDAFVVSTETSHSLCRDFRLSTKELLLALVEVARPHARPPVSNYHVGVAGLGNSGQIYLGVNLEFTGQALNQSVHAEQFMVVQAVTHNEEGLKMMAGSAPPCGHCRQWLYEVNGGSTLEVITPGSPATLLSSLLPHAFGPHDLDNRQPLLYPRSPGTQTAEGAAIPGCVSDAEKEPLILAAGAAADLSYAPYSHCPAGVAIRTRDGRIHPGRYLENVAFNPSLGPLQFALVLLVARGYAWDELEEVCLVEKAGSISQEHATRTLLTSIAPHAPLHVRRF